MLAYCSFVTFCNKIIRMSELYKQSGVNIDEATSLDIKLFGANKKELDRFAGAVEADGVKLVTCCDGIGSKIIPLLERKLYNTIAVDLVAANLNDLATQDAKAVLFVDYIAVHKLDSDVISKIVLELKHELFKYNCILASGETSELPHILQEGKIDICGFVTGLGTRDKRLGTSMVKNGDTIIGLKSSGIHANGFTLVRKLYDEGRLTDSEFEACLKPTCVYYSVMRKLWEKGLVKSAAHITGGGIYNNLMRAIPPGFDASLDVGSIPGMMIYRSLERLIGDEIWEVFNCGVGFCIIAAQEDAAKILEITAEFEPFILGTVREL